MTATFDAGQLVTLDFTVTSTAGAPLVPGTITLTVQDPAGALTPYTPAADSPGVYHQDLTPLLTGRWRYRWVTTGAGQTAADGEFAVQAPFTSTTSTADIAVYLQQRIRTRDGNTGGVLDTTTVPTAVQVQALIGKVTADVTGGLGVIPPALAGLTQTAVELGTATLVLLQFFEADQTYRDLDARYQSSLTRLREAVDVASTTGDPNAVSAEDGKGGSGGDERPPAPSFSFPITQPSTYAYPLPVTTAYERY